MGTVFGLYVSVLSFVCEKRGDGKGGKREGDGLLNNCTWFGFDLVFVSGDIG